MGTTRLAPKLQRKTIGPQIGFASTRCKGGVFFEFSSSSLFRVLSFSRRIALLLGDSYVVRERMIRNPPPNDSLRMGNLFFMFIACMGKPVQDVREAEVFLLSPYLQREKERALSHSHVTQADPECARLRAGPPTKSLSQANNHLDFQGLAELGLVDMFLSSRCSSC